MSVRVTVWPTLVCPVMVFVRFSVGVPRDAVVISVVLRHMQIYLVIPIVEHSTAIIGVVVAVSYTEWRRISPSATVIQCSTRLIGEVLRTMRCERIAPICHGSVLAHNIVSVTRTIRLVNTTEVDVDVAVRLRRDPDIILVLKRNSSLCGQLLTLLSACRLQFIEPGAESLGA